MSTAVTPSGPVIDYSVSQQDEFLRRATAPSAGVRPRVVLRRLADTARGLAPTVRAGQTRAQYARALREVAR